MTAVVVTVLVTLLGVAGCGCGASIKDLQQKGPIRGSSDQKVAGSSPAGRTTHHQGFTRINCISSLPCLLTSCSLLGVFGLGPGGGGRSDVSTFCPLMRSGLAWDGRPLGVRVWYTWAST